MGRTGIYACGESVRRRNSLESVALFSLKQEAPASIGGSTFTLTVDKMRTAMSIKTGDNPVQTVEVLGDRYVLNKLERASILRHFIMGNDYSHFGLVNAVTRSSQDVQDYNRATELERIGGTLLDEGVEAVSKRNIILLPKSA